MTNKGATEMTNAERMDSNDRTFDYSALETEAQVSDRTGALAPDPDFLPTSAAPVFPHYTDIQIEMINYLADLEDDFDDRDYSAYATNGDAIRDADLAMIAKVADAIVNNVHVFAN